MRGALAAPLIAFVLAAPARAERPIAWQEWSDDVFSRAGHEKRFVLLDLGAVWCHWCHVMEETTYRDPKVVELVGARFLPVRVDQDSRPDLSNRYEDYGWPATVVFDARGQELVKFAGYIAPARMASLLQGIIDDPTPGPSVQPEDDVKPALAPLLPDALRQELEALLVSRYDEDEGGWGFAKKFLDWDSVEWSILRAREGDASSAQRALQTLDRQTRLIDPVWGGVYQYSHGGNWQNPHFEKIMQMQAENLRIFSIAYAWRHDPSYLKAGKDILRYLRGFLRSPDGAFYVSQDADLVQGEHGGEYFALGDGERRKRGIPRIDTHLYARENAWAVSALAAYADASGDQDALADALAAARWLLANRALEGGGFRHDARDPAGPYLGDSVAAGRAFLALYSASSDREWLMHAERAAGFIARSFRPAGATGFLTAASAPGGIAPKPQRDENVMLARFASGLARLTGKAEYRRMAEDAMRYLAVPEVAKRFSSAAALLAERDLRAPAPSH
jgi:uncharacterized protein YyaL (SSP411 family)